jgi:hypothetical protein
MNAKQEFIQAIQGNNVLCVLVRFGTYHFVKKSVVLTTGYTKEEYNQFLDDIDFEYDSGYGSQHLYGTIWFCDGTWCSRGEYDGSEWWEYNECPEIPSELNRIDKVREIKLNKLLDGKI